MKSKERIESQLYAMRCSRLTEWEKENQAASKQDWKKANQFNRSRSEYEYGIRVLEWVLKGDNQ